MRELYAERLIFKEGNRDFLLHFLSNIEISIFFKDLRTFPLVGIKEDIWWACLGTRDLEWWDFKDFWVDGKNSFCVKMLSLWFNSLLRLEVSKSRVNAIFFFDFGPPDELILFWTFWVWSPYKD